MLITNGTLQCEQVTGGSVDEYGVPTPQTATWGAAIPAAIETLNDNKKGSYVDGVFHKASYSITIEGIVDSFAARRVRIVRRGKWLADADVLSVVPNEAVWSTTILV